MINNELEGYLNKLKGDNKEEAADKIADLLSSRFSQNLFCEITFCQNTGESSVKFNPSFVGVTRSRSDGDS